MNSEYFGQFQHTDCPKPSKQCLIFRNRFVLPIEIEEIIIKYYNQIRSDFLEKTLGSISTKSLIHELCKRDNDSDGAFYHRMYRTYSREMRRLYGVPHEEDELAYAEQNAHAPVNMSINYNRVIDDTIFNIDVYSQHDVYGVIEDMLLRRQIYPGELHGRYVVDYYDHCIQREWEDKTEHERREHIRELFPTIKFNFIRDYGLVSLMRQRENFEDAVYRTLRLECVNRPANSHVANTI